MPPDRGEVMICYYKVNMAGPYHIDNNIPCQDSYSIEQNGNVICVAVADGLGSEVHSDIGSAVASETATRYCMEHYCSGMAVDKVKSIMNNAFVYAYKAVLQAASDAGDSEDEYDTTLCLVIFDDSHVYYGQSGDSGITALLQNGHYMKVTEQQRDEDGCVYPLCWGPEKWVFGEISEPVSAVMLMTDGVFEEICPPVLKDREININIPLAKKFMDHVEADEETIGLIEEAAYKYLKNYPRRLLDDDKTVVVVYNPSAPADQLEESYYAVPDWTQIYKDINDSIRNNNDEQIDEQDADFEEDGDCKVDPVELAEEQEQDETEPDYLDKEDASSVAISDVLEVEDKKKLIGKENQAEYPGIA